MGTWEDLPNELAFMIFEWLDHQKPMEQGSSPRVNEDILQCTYVSRQFRAIVEPILYREVKIRAENGGDDDDMLPQFRCLARTIALRPELGALIQKLDASGLAMRERTHVTSDLDGRDDWRTTTYSPETIAVYLDERPDEVRSDKKVLLDAIARLHLPNGLIVAGDSISEFILLLHLLHQLRELQMGMTDEMSIIAVASLGAFAGGVPAGLQSLSKLSIFCEDIEVIRHSHETSWGRTDSHCLLRPAFLQVPLRRS